MAIQYVTRSDALWPALELTCALGACQMRSWSSLDKTANYALKLSLGFAAHPAVQTAGLTGEPISGV